jgi:hypothetical protein
MNSTEFRSLCSSWRSDFDGFARVVASALELGLSRRELALTFRVPESWIKAWANGGAPPHPLAQEYIVDILKKRVEELLDNNLNLCL